MQKKFLMYCIVYFTITFILYTFVAISFLNKDDIDMIKQEGNFGKQADVILVYSEVAKFKPNIMVIYKENKRIHKEKIYVVTSQQEELANILYKIKKNNILKYLWYFNLVNLIIYIVIRRKEKNELMSKL